MTSAPPCSSFDSPSGASSGATSWIDLAACDFQDSREWASSLDARDPLHVFRSRFSIPPHTDGLPCVYLTGNSLGLKPYGVREVLLEKLEDWAHLGVDGHMKARKPWVDYHLRMQPLLAKLVGAHVDEVVAMNTLTLNLHLMMVSFYRPTEKRATILIEKGAFPSDTYAVMSHLRTRGLDPAEYLVQVAPREGERTLRMDDVVARIRELGDTLALVLLPGVHYATGQVLDIARITREAHAAGATCGWDLAHSIGNAPLQLHDWGPDFACWCSYKYLNGGAGAVAGCFVHRRHADDHSIPRYLGWWGNAPGNRFEMRDDFTPTHGADGWQLSNPPILSMAPLLVSVPLFMEAGLDRLRQKSLALSGYLMWLLAERATPGATVVTPSSTSERASQVSIAFAKNAHAIHRALLHDGYIVDFREPDIIRAAPTALYGSFEDVWRFVDRLDGLARR